MLHRGWFRSLLLLCVGAAAWGQGGPPGGAVSELLQFAGDPVLLYAATNNGVLRSTDGGLSWSETGDRLHGVSISSVAGDSTVLYAASLAEGVFRSRDEGATWEQVNQGLDVTAIASLAADPTNVNTVYAGSADGGVFKTTDSGDTWAPSRTGLLQGVYLDIAVDPGNPQIIYGANASLAVSGGGGLSKSTDGGQSWSNSGPFAVFSVTVDPSNSNVIYLGTAIGVLKSTTGGPPFSSTLSSFVVVDVTVDPADPAVVYAATQFARVVKSTDGGQNWVSSSQGIPRSELLMISLSLHDPSVLFAGSNGGGLFRSADGGANWDLSSRGLHFAEISALAVAPSGGAVLAAVPSGGAYRSLNGGAGWGPANGGLESFALHSLVYDPSNPNIVYAGSVNPFNANDGSLLKSTDGGLQWQVLQTSAPFYAVAAHPSDGRTVVIGSGNGVFRSTDGGQSFQGINGDGEVIQRVVDLKFHPSTPTTLFVIVFDDLSTGFYEIFRSTDGGADWTGSGPTAVPLLDIAIDSNDPSRIYVAAGNGVFRSTDGGGEYRAANAGFPAEGVLVSSVAVDANANSTVYASTSAGVFRSTDRADSWQSVDAGLEEQGVLDLAPDPREAGVLYAATVGGGVFKTVDGGESWQPTGGVPILTGAGVVNAADFGGGGVTPGEIVSIFGVDLGPAEGVQPGIDPQTGRLATSAAGVRVIFNDVAAPLFFVRADQLNVQVPFEVAGLSRVTVRVEFEGAVSARVSLPVLPSHPGQFAPVLNQDGALNSEDNRENPGRVVQLFATGQGLVDPALDTGALAPGMEPFPRATETVRVTIGGRSAPVHFSGLAPGFVGLLQVNAQIDSAVPAGPAEVIIEISGRIGARTGTVWVD
jgi:uncharacterized protein (TIGR03437 family)